MNAEELRSYLYEHIPLARAMEMEVVEPGPGRVVLSAPLEPNTNHRSTAFGGSVSALATLAGWVAVHSRLREEGRTAQVVIQRGTMEYLLPVRRPFRAVCPGIGEEEWRRLRRALERSGKGRARLDVHVEVEGGTVGRFEGTYVAVRSGGVRSSG